MEFIKNNIDWEQKLSEKPYCITTKRKDNFIMFCYSQIDSDFYNPIVRECRGIILDCEYKPVCVPFYKFGNYGEGYVDTIDWSSAKTQEKVDGSLIKVWNYKGNWHVSTNGTIDAKDATLQCDISPYTTFYDLFIEASKNSNLNIGDLNINYTWIFELISPYNRVVVPHVETKLKHIGTRDIHTLKEYNFNIGVDRPKTYDFKSFAECVAMAAELPFSDEGYVVVDKHWNRNKIKSPAYVAAHHLKNNGVSTKSRIVEMIKANESEEFLTYYPEFKDGFDNIQEGIEQFCTKMDNVILKLDRDEGKTNRKEFAKYATTFKCPAVLFNWLDNKCETTSEWLWKQTNDKIIQWIGV